VNDENHSQALTNGLMKKLVDGLPGLSDCHAMQVDMGLNGKLALMKATCHFMGHIMPLAFNILRRIRDMEATAVFDKIF